VPGSTEIAPPASAAERLAEARARIAAGERLRGPVATTFYAAVHGYDPTATEDTIATLPGNSGVHLYDSLIAWASLVAGERVLDIGCGSGGAARSAARIVGPTGMVVGVDPCRAALDIARERALDDAPMAFVTASAERMVDIPDRGFDCVIASLALEEINDLRAALSEIHRVLRPGGRFVASVSSFDRFRPVDASFMGAVMAVITRRAPAALAGRATRASFPSDPDDVRAFAEAGLLIPEERDVQLAAVMDDIHQAWAILGRTHMAYLLDDEGQAELREVIARRLPHALYFPLRFLRSRRPG
jgi:ubiquinone/menaquinone biosynthesis C-methylase UbiE